MSFGAPSLLSTFVIAGDAFLVAELSCTLAKRGAYLPIVEAPRMQRPDAEAEVLRCNNAAARARPRTILFAGVPQDTVRAFGDHFPKRRTHSLNAVDQLPPIEHPRRVHGTLVWGRKNIGLGLLRALRERCQIVFDDDAESPTTTIPPEPGCDHLVVYEDDTDLGAVIAANYAYALGAGLARIPAVPKEDRERILETFYAVYDNREHAPKDTLRGLACELKQHAVGLTLDDYRLATFITRELPWGFAFPECPTTHLFSYPDLGKSILAGVLSE